MKNQKRKKKDQKNSSIETYQKKAKTDMEETSSEDDVSKWPIFQKKKEKEWHKMSKKEENNDLTWLSWSDHQKKAAKKSKLEDLEVSSEDDILEWPIFKKRTTKEEQILLCASTPNASSPNDLVEGTLDRDDSSSDLEKSAKKEAKTTRQCIVEAIHRCKRFDKGTTSLARGLP